MKNRGDRNQPSRLWISIFMTGVVLLIAALLFFPTKSPLQISLLALSMILFIFSGMVGAAKRP